MSVVYTWSVNSFEKLKVKDAFTDVAATVYGELVAEDSATGTRVSRPFSVDLDLSSLDANNFISFESLTEENAIAWVNAVWGEEAVNAEKAALEAQLTEALNRDFCSAPWIPVPTAP